MADYLFNASRNTMRTNFLFPNKMKKKPIQPTPESKPKIEEDLEKEITRGNCFTCPKQHEWICEVTEEKIGSGNEYCELKDIKPESKEVDNFCKEDSCSKNNPECLGNHYPHECKCHTTLGRKKPESKERKWEKELEDYVAPEPKCFGNAPKPESKDWEDRLWEDLGFEEHQKSHIGARIDAPARRIYEDLKDLIRSEKKKSFEEGKEYEKRFPDEITSIDIFQVRDQAKEELRKDVKNWIDNFAFLFPHQVKRSKEWLNGYNYCKKGVKRELDDLINFLNKTK